MTELSSDTASTTETPVVLIIFRRPDTTRRVLDAIRQAHPKQLLVIADGPREGHPTDKKQCQAARDVITEVDWDCDVRRNYADENMGCRQRVATGLDWVFDQVDRAIILEDDCVPDPSFFDFQEAMLRRYEEDTRIMHVAGTNMGVVGSTSADSYYFARQTFIWGWGTWRRAWEQYDVAMQNWSELRNRDEVLKNLLVNETEYKVRRHLWEETYRGNIDTWDYQWLFSVLCSGGLSIVPNKNMISNIGFGSDATHTTAKNPASELDLESMSFPLKHPNMFVRDVLAEKRYVQMMHEKNLLQKVKSRLTDVLEQLGIW